MSVDAVSCNLAANQRNRLKRMVKAIQRPVTAADIADLDGVLRRADPERLQGTAQSRYIGMNALTLTRESLNSLKKTGYVFHKVNGIGVLGAMFAQNAGRSSSAKTTFDTSSTARNTMVFVRRNGIFAVDNVALPLRRGRVLIEGELCIRRKELSMSERSKLKGPISSIIGFNYMDPDDDLPESDVNYEVCFAAHDLLVDDESHASNSRSKTGDSLCVQNPTERFKRLLALTQCPPTDDQKAKEAIGSLALEFETAQRRPSICVFFKQPYCNINIRLALRTLPECLHGIPIDGLIFMPGTGHYTVNQTNPDLLKHKDWRDNSGDFVFVRSDDGTFRFYVVNNDNKARCISTKMWLGDTEDEKKIAQAAIDMELQRISNGGDPSTPLIFECEPSLEDRDAFFALRDKHMAKADLMLAAGEMLRWRPIGVIRDEKMFPNSERNFWTIVEALIDCITPDDIIKQIGGQ